MSLRVIAVDDTEKRSLKERVLSLGEVSRLSDDPKFFAKLVALGLHQEIGTIHDEIATFAYDGRTGEKLPARTLASEIVQFKDYTGVRIRSRDTEHLDIRVPGIRQHFHPEFSESQGDHFRSVVTFPEISLRIAALEKVDLVFVKPWAINTIFGGYDVTKSYYESNLWEVVNLDSLRYARLAEDRKVAYLGTHDLVSHIAGAQAAAWPDLQATAHRVRSELEAYYQVAHDAKRELRPVALVIPHVIGLLLDDLAQPMNYRSESRKHVLGLLLDEVRARSIPPTTQKFLLKYPESVKGVIEVARGNDVEKARALGAKFVSRLVAELLGMSVDIPTA